MVHHLQGEAVLGIFTEKSADLQSNGLSSQPHPQSSSGVCQSEKRPWDLGGETEKLEDSR
jgi:hypothetical protein